MNNSRKKVLFIYRGSTQKRILDGQSGKVPTEFLYGMNCLNKDAYEIKWINAPRDEAMTLFRRFCHIFEKPFSKKVRLGIPFEIFPLFWKEIQWADVVICINDPISLGILLWKRFGFIKSRVITIIQSLPEREKYFSDNRNIKNFISSLLHSSDLILTLSKTVHQDFIRWFNLAGKNVKVFYFGVDSDFWKDTSAKENNFVLSIGNDTNRDFQTLISAIPAAIPLKIVTAKTIDTQGKNIEILNNITDEELRDLYNRCLFVVVPSIKIKNESSGLSCTLQAMACKKPVILSQTPTLTELFTDKKHCLFYEAENVEDLREKITTLYDNKQYRNLLGRDARKFITLRNSSYMASQLDGYIREVLSGQHSTSQSGI